MLDISFQTYSKAPFIKKKDVKGTLLNVQVSVQDWNVVVYRRKISKAFNIRRRTETETETERAI